MFKPSYQSMPSWFVVTWKVAYVEQQGLVTTPSIFSMGHLNSQTPATLSFWRYLAKHPIPTWPQSLYFIYAITVKFLPISQAKFPLKEKHCEDIEAIQSAETILVETVSVNFHNLQKWQHLHVYIFMVTSLTRPRVILSQVE